MLRIILCMLLMPLGLCAAVPACAAARAASRPASDILLPRSALNAAPVFLDHTAEPPVFREHARGQEWTIERIAGKVSYAGILLLTADHLVRKVDSILERAQIRRDDGTRLRLEQPSAGRMGLMITVSCPLEF